MTKLSICENLHLIYPTANALPDGISEAFHKSENILSAQSSLKHPTPMKKAR